MNQRSSQSLITKASVQMPEQLLDVDMLVCCSDVLYFVLIWSGKVSVSVEGLLFDRK
jgi:hypothetical protein